MDWFFELFAKLITKAVFHALVWEPIQQWGIVVWAIVAFSIVLLLYVAVLSFKKLSPVTRKPKR